jgi:putative hydrolase of the HAD superfamily
VLVASSLVMTPPRAVLLDVGGVFLLPSRSHIRSALSRVGHVVTDDDTIDRAHYEAVRAFPMDLHPGDWMGPYWNDYLDWYARVVGVTDDRIPEATEHLRNEYVTSELWSHEVVGAREGLAHLARTGVSVGVVSNSDGTIERRLRDLGILQVGPGNGVEVVCVVDSGTVGVEKPDPRIFEFALQTLALEPDGVWYVGDTPAFDIVGARRAGIDPILMDPFATNGDYGVPTVTSLTDVAQMVTGIS